MDKRSEMIELDEALRVVEQCAAGIELVTEMVNVDAALGRVLAGDGVSRLALPPFNKSAMDGYAVMDGDERDEYKVLEFIAAGSTPTTALTPGTASKVMTGAPVPDGSGKVIMVEFTEETDGTVKVFKHSSNSNICVMGEDVGAGDVVMSGPVLLGPLEIANLISCGISEVEVFRKVRVAVVSTGDEIVDDPSKIAPGMIMNSNGPLLAGLCQQYGLEVASQTVLKDDRKSTVAGIKAALDGADIVILSGGVSMGDLDFVDTAMGDVGLKVHFNRVAVKPGKPMTFASTENKAVFGLPGNPVSVYLMFHLFVLRAAMLINGIKTPELTKLPIAEDFKRKKTDRALFAPGIITPDGKVEQVKYHGSAHLMALMKADGFFFVEKGVGAIDAGERVKFMRVR